MADLGMARRRKRAKEKDVDVTDLPRKKDKPQVTVSDIESIKANVASMRGEIQEIRDAIPVKTEDEASAVESKITEHRERIYILETLVSGLTGQVTALEIAFANFDVGNYEVEEFPL